jgi:hypothetical protein
MTPETKNRVSSLHIEDVHQPPRPTSRISFLESEEDKQSASSMDKEPQFSDPTEEELDILSDIAIEDGITFEDDSTEEEDESQDILSPLFSNPDTPSIFPLPKHHGPSRSHLIQLKSFWAMREGEWDMRRAYDGVMSSDDDDSFSSPSSSRSSSPSPPPGLNNTRPSSPPPTKRSPPSTPITMHPRRGDILALRDPYCAQVDRCFAGLPLWTMSKTFFMFDLHIACKMMSSSKISLDSPSSSPGFTASSLDCVEDEDNRDGAFLPGSLSTGDSSDSDMTLVDSGSEDDLSPIEPSSRSSWLALRESSPEDWETWEDVNLSDQSDSPSSSLSESPSIDKERHQSSQSHISAYISRERNASATCMTSSPSHENSAQESKIPRPRLMRRHANEAPPPPMKRLDSDSTVSSSSAKSGPVNSSVGAKDDSESDDTDDDYSTLMVDEDDPFVWSKDWYRRWDLLTRLVRLDQTRKRSQCSA